MKLNEIDFNLLSDKELIILCLKYKLIERNDIQKLNRDKLLIIIKQYLIRKLQVYGQRKKRSMSISDNLQRNQIHNQSNNLPRTELKRTLSDPITTNEKVHSHNIHELNQVRQNSQEKINHEIKSLNPQYDIIGMYPPVKKLIAIGDLHGDLRVTLMALKLAEVIPQQSTEQNINNIHWCGGSTWIIQLGDQIDRCRPDDWEKNCIKDFDDVFEDEGNNMIIIRLLLRLDD